MVKATRVRPQLAILASLGVVHVAAVITQPSQGVAAEGPMRLCASLPTQHPQAVGTLPAPVAAMRDAILEAVHSGRLADLREALELNELKPELGPAPVPDPLAYWRRLSADGEGHDVLAALGALFDAAPCIEPLGRDLENSYLYIWPAFADRPLTTMTPEEIAQLQRLEGPGKAAEMAASGHYTGWRVVIGADGVWHSFRRYD